MGHSVGRVCVCVSEHRPAPLDLERHHILPLAMGGSDDAPNTVWVCSTAHTNVHDILREIFKRDGALTWSDALARWDAPVSRYAFALAHEGYRRFRESHA